MKALKKLACAAAVAMSMMSAANAGVVLNNWKFNANGGGETGAQNVIEYLDVNGNAFIELSRTEGSQQFTFVEHAVFNISQADSRTLLPAGVTATFEAFGSGTLSGAFTFGGGQITMYKNSSYQYGTDQGYFGANLGDVIATFNVLAGGGGRVDASGNPVGNGQVSVFAQASTPNGLAPGYFFRGDGTDLSNEDILSFAFTNANGLQAPDQLLINELACQFAAFTGDGCNGSAYNAQDGSFFVGNNGQFKLAEVPEPGSLALFGIAMLGAGVVSRKRAKKA